MLVCPASMPLYNDVSLPPRKHTGGQVQSPPGGTGVGRGGGMVSRASGTPIYILIYILALLSKITYYGYRRYYGKVDKC